MSEPWEEYANPVATPPETRQTAAGELPLGGVDWADVGKGSLGGLGRGTAALLGLPGTVGELARAGMRKAGVPEQGIEASRLMMRANPLLSPFAGPGARAVQGEMEKVIGPLYEPKTTAGQYASTIGEFAPSALIPGVGGGLLARATNVVVPAVASETAGQITKGSAIEPWARAGAGIGAGLGMGKIITPTAPPTVAHAEAVDRLRQQGIPLSAAERTGSKALGWLEASAADMPLSSRAAQAMKDRQGAAIDRRVTEQVFDPGELAVELAMRGERATQTLPSQQAMAAGRQTLSDAYTDLSGRNVMRNGPTLQRDLARAQNNYERLALPSQRATGARDVAGIRDEITQSLIQNGPMPGDVYQATRSRLGTLAKEARNTNSALANALTDIRTALDNAMRRRLSPQDAARWDETNRRWANMRQLEAATVKDTEHLSPQAIAQALKGRRKSEYARGAGPMDQFSRDLSQVVKPLPQSGTSPRSGWRELFNMPVAASVGGGGALGALVGAPIAGAAIGFAPHVAARAALSRPGQAYLGNQFMPQNARDIIAQTVAEQAMTAPFTVARNEREREAIEARTRAQRRALGLE